MTIALAVTRTTPDDHQEAELATVERHGDCVLVALDDGQTLQFDAWELIGAMGRARPSDQADDEPQAA